MSTSNLKKYLGRVFIFYKGLDFLILGAEKEIGG